MKKQVLYWAGLLLLTAAGCVVCLKSILPVKNTLVFFLGLYWLWRGTATLFRFDVSPERTRTPRLRLGFAAMDFGLGTASMILSFLSRSLLPALLVLLFFLLLALLFRKYGQE